MMTSLRAGVVSSATAKTPVSNSAKTILDAGFMGQFLHMRARPESGLACAQRFHICGVTS
jgi:hypothetical protein